MTRGKTLEPQDLLNILRRRRREILLPFVAIALASAAVVQLLPNKYRSETLIMVMPEHVPESYVRSTVTARIEDRLRSINQQITSRTRLEPLVKEFNLYPDLVRKLVMEEVIERMRADIQTQLIRTEVFRISYVSKNAETAMKVTERLATMYIDESRRDREMLADSTNQFINSQLDTAKARLVEQEQRIDQFKIKFSGQLPSQIATNLQVMQNVQLQIQSIVDSVNRDRDRQLMLQDQLADREAGPPPGGAEAAAGNQARIRQIRAEIDRLSKTVERKEEEEAHLRSVVAEYQARLQASPTREAELTELMRDFETLQKSYTTLLAKKDDAQVSANLERRQIGAQFKVLDAARLPEKPFRPQRLLLDAIGATLGLIAGLLLAAILEYRDTSLRTEGDIAAILTLPVLAIVPDLALIDEILERPRGQLTPRTRSLGTR